MKSTSSTKPSSPLASASAPTAPKTKYPIKWRGTMTQLDADGNCEFRSQVPSGSSQEVIAQSGDAKLYRTTGKRSPKMVAHLSVAADSADPAAQLYQQLGRMTKSIQKRVPKALQGILLVDGPYVKLVHSEKEQRLQCIIEFDLTNPDLQSQLLSHLQTINQCLAINRTSFFPPKR